MTKVGIFLAEKWTYKVIDICKVSDKMFVIKISVQGITVISFYAPQCGLDESQKDYFYDCLVSVASMFVEKEVFAIAGYFTGHVLGGAEDYVKARDEM